jgi:hypothetical protein
VALAQLVRAAHVLERHGLTAAGVVGQRQHHEWDPAGVLRETPLEPAQVHVPLEGVASLRLLPLRDDEIHRDAAVDLDIGARRIEVRVVGHDVAGLQDGREQEVLRDTSLVGRDDVRETEDLADGPVEMIEVAASGVGFVSAHQPRPLRVGHRGGSRIRQQVDVDVLGGDAEDVVAGLHQSGLPLGASDAPDRLDDFDPPGLGGQVFHLLNPGRGARSLPVPFGLCFFVLQAARPIDEILFEFGHFVGSAKVSQRL